MIVSYGWSDARAREFRPLAASGLVPGRVVSQQRGLLRLLTEDGDLVGDLAGRLVHEAAPNELPVAGDWVACLPRPSERRATIHAVLPRTSLFIRKEAGRRSVGQPIGANVDIALLIMAVGSDLNLSRLERYLVLARDAGAEPVIVLTKSDLCPDLGDTMEAVLRTTGDLPVLSVSSFAGQGLEALADHLPPRCTAVLLGSSGAGKSTLANALLGRDRMETGGVRAADERGRHTTTHRELILLPGGSLLLDTPGMRELGLIDADRGLAGAFGDLEDEIARLSASCRFRDCRHEAEPGCAVRAAREDGRIDDRQWRNRAKLRREMAHLDRRDDKQAQSEQRRHWAKASQSSRAARRRRDEES